MTEKELIQENERLQIENQKLLARIAQILAELRKLHTMTVESSCAALATIAFIEGTKR